MGWGERTFQDFENSLLVYLLKLKIQQNLKININKPLQGILTLLQPKHPHQPSPIHFALEPFKLFRRNRCTPLPVVDFSGGEEDVGLEVDIKEFAPAIQI